MKIGFSKTHLDFLKKYKSGEGLIIAELEIPPFGFSELPILERESYGFTSDSIPLLNEELRFLAFLNDWQREHSHLATKVVEFEKGSGQILFRILSKGELVITLKLKSEMPRAEKLMFFSSLSSNPIVRALSLILLDAFKENLFQEIIGDIKNQIQNLEDEISFNKELIGEFKEERREVTESFKAFFPEIAAGILDKL